MGIPTDEIAFVHDAKTEAQRDEMFEKVRKGEIRVIMGSTSKLGTGTNIQNLLIAEHDLDVPWRPSDVTQRTGRILRQGNNNPVVKVFRYVTKNTFDAFLWQVQEQKLRYITQVMTAKSIVRSCEDADETVLTAAEIKAIATSNPLLAEKMQVDNEVTRLKLLRANWNNERLSLERNIENYYPNQITRLEKRTVNIENDITLFKKNISGDFKIKIDGTVYNERVKAGEAFVTSVKAKCEVGSGSVEIGEYCGLNVFCERKLLTDAEIQIKGNGYYSAPVGDSALGCITRIENIIKKLPDWLKEAQQELERARSQLEEAKIEVVKPFEFEEKLNEYTAKQSEINTKLEFKELSTGVDELIEGNLDNTDNTEEIEEEYEDEEDIIAV